MLPSHLMQLKSLLMVLTAALGTVAGGTVINSFVGGTPRNGGAFLLSSNPSSLTLEQGATASSRLTLTSINSFTGTVVLSLYFPNGKLPVLLNPATLSLPANGTATSTLTVNATTSTTMGNYTIAVIAASVQKKAIYASTTLSVQITSNRDFTISVAPTSISNLAGSSNTTRILLNSLNGFSGTISLSATVPFGYISVTGGQSPVTLTSGGTASSTLQISTSSTTLPGTYNITVTGTSGSLTHSRTITLKVSDPTPPVAEALALASFSFSSNTNLTLSIQNTGTTTVTLQSYSIRDSIGDTWTLTNWAGPIIAPNVVAPANILISTSCSGCTYTGILGLFNQFVPGQTYTVVVTTAKNSQFSFTVTY